MHAVIVTLITQFDSLTSLPIYLYKHMKIILKINIHELYVEKCIEHKCNPQNHLHEYNKSNAIKYIKDTAKIRVVH